jgi:hypothetical protein
LPSDNFQVRQETPDSPRVADAYGHHIHNRQTPIDIQPEHEPKVARVADAERLNTPEDSSDEHDVDDVERIKDSIGDNVDRETKLFHPEDDDASLSDVEHPKFEDDGQARLGNTPQKSIKQQVDELLNADHPSKEPDDLSQDEETDVEEVPESDQPFQARIETLQEQTPWSEKYSFPSWDECESLKDKADSLPDMIHVTFEESVKDVRLDGWEDEWIAKARFSGPKLQEPKIDFVYNCENNHSRSSISY